MAHKRLVSLLFELEESFNDIERLSLFFELITDLMESPRDKGFLPKLDLLLGHFESSHRTTLKGMAEQFEELRAYRKELRKIEMEEKANG